MKAGPIELTGIPFAAYSIAAVLVNPITPCFAAT
jgi:hypothetical protein